ncbi:MULTISPECIES: hypothetical protein [unclassified Helicobacter]|uniref:hypothetical protein n=1 Tax=unclassified Helicobacter TaxID=2593540 RepID=UPI000CF04184|nr:MULTISPECIES: hypothetical protein [unclassified Helicobacter]
MINHYLLTIPYIALVFLILTYFRAKTINYYFGIIAVILVCNIPFYHTLSLNDLTFSVVGSLSVFSLIFYTLICLETFQFKKKKIFLISKKGFIYIALTHLIFYLCFLNVIPLNIYYLDERNTLLIGCGVILFSFFFDKILSIIYLICLFAYALKILEYNNIFDYLFDVVFFIISILTLIFKLLKK